MKRWTKGNRTVTIRYNAVRRKWSVRMIEFRKRGFIGQQHLFYGRSDASTVARDFLAGAKP